MLIMECLIAGLTVRLGRVSFRAWKPSGIVETPFVFLADIGLSDRSRRF